NLQARLFGRFRHGQDCKIPDVLNSIVVFPSDLVCMRKCVHEDAFVLVQARSSSRGTLEYQWYARLERQDGTQRRELLVGKTECLLKLSPTEIAALMVLEDPGERGATSVLNLEVEILEPATKARRVMDATMSFRTTPQYNVMDAVILEHPKDSEVFENESASFKMTLREDRCGCRRPHFQYQWQLDGKDIPGQNALRIRIPEVTAENEGMYTCKISMPSHDVTATRVSGGGRLRIVAEPPTFLEADGEVVKPPEVRNAEIAMEMLTPEQPAQMQLLALTLPSIQHVTLVEEHGGELRRAQCSAGGIQLMVSVKGATSHDWFCNDQPLGGKCTTSLHLRVEDLEAAPDAVYYYMARNRFGATKSESVQCSWEVPPPPRARRPQDLELISDSAEGFRVLGDPKLTQFMQPASGICWKWIYKEMELSNPWRELSLAGDDLSLLAIPLDRARHAIAANQGELRFKYRQIVVDSYGQAAVSFAGRLEAKLRCIICLEDASEIITTHGNDNMLMLPSCNNTCCKPCLRRYFAQLVEAGSRSIPCPGQRCSHDIHDLIEAHASKQTAQQFIRLSYQEYSDRFTTAVKDPAFWEWACNGLAKTWAAKSTEPQSNGENVEDDVPQKRACTQNVPEPPPHQAHRRTAQQSQA
ncbi:hypothetical protein CYMTET_22966, partial [Cymbomonas tetramitiformis]